MTVTINGSSGVATPLGSAGSPSTVNTSNSTTGLYFPASNTVGVATAGTNALYIDASQNVGIGTTSPTQTLEVLGTNQATDSRGNVFFRTSNTQAADVGAQLALGGLYNASSSYGFGGIAGRKENSTSGNVAGYLQFFTTTSGGTFTERMRIDSSGNLTVGGTTSYGKITGYIGANSGTAVASYFTASGGTGVGFQANYGASTGTGYGMYFTYNGSGCGSITLTSGATAFNTSSDYRLKENVQPLTTGLATLNALKPVTYDWIFNKEKGEGFIAHELQTVIPLAVVGEKDAVNEDGSIKPQGVDYGKIVVHLVAAIQELSAEVTALKAKVGA
jgi:Chaperone of endosialidase